LDYTTPSGLHFLPVSPESRPLASLCIAFNSLLRVRACFSRRTPCLLSRDFLLVLFHEVFTRKFNSPVNQGICLSTSPLPSSLYSLKEKRSSSSPLLNPSFFLPPSFSLNSPHPDFVIFFFSPFPPILSGVLVQLSDGVPPPTRGFLLCSWQADPCPPPPLRRF